ncbi:MAG: hypothetical protein KA783_07325 [Chitinophagales bacterium]|jgi:hypothetical protein|nr:hypothetical protein [Sphingobacteriales bacterium]MBP6664278.1 hypothetical protein [Chitinophagales bacterium]MBP7534243.1 hypothetical protein [Chitinophagales bacterium]
MSGKKYHLTQLHAENKFWVTELLFFKDEITYFETQLARIITNNTAQEVMVKVEHFQNQFIRQREVIDEVKHNIKASENELQAFATSHNEIAIGHALFADHVELREEMDTFKKLYSELKDEFRHFLAKWM